MLIIVKQLVNHQPKGKKIMSAPSNKNHAGAFGNSNTRKTTVKAAERAFYTRKALVKVKHRKRPSVANVARPLVKAGYPENVLMRLADSL